MYGPSMRCGGQARSCVTSWSVLASLVRCASLLGCASLAGCAGAAAPRGEAAVPSRIVLQGVSGERIEDRLEGLELVSSAHGELVVRDASGVRARRRFGFVTSRVAGRFVRDVEHVVVSSADDGGRLGTANPRDPFGMSSGVLVVWDVTSDEVTSLAPTPDAAPALCRAGASVIALDEGHLALVGAESLVLAPESADELVEAGGRCWARRGTEWLAVTPSVDAITLDAGAAPTRAPLASETAAVGPFVDRIEWAGLAPSSDALALGSREHAFVLSADGARSILTPHQDCAWRSNGLVACGQVLVPIALETRRGPSLVRAQVRSVADADPWNIPEIASYDAWVRAADAAEGSGSIPPFPIEPVCSETAPIACVRAHLSGTRVDGWELVDPAAPEVVRARLPITVPPGAGHVFVSPGGRFVRETTSGVAIHAMVPGEEGVIVGTGSWTEIRTGWAELPTGWVVVDPGDAHVLRALRREGPAIERRFDVALDRLTIVDETHVFVRVPREAGDEGHVIDAATLESTRVLSLGRAGEDRVLRCRGAGLVSAEGAASAGACPLAGADAMVTVAASGAFWLDARRLDQLVVHRTRDGATLAISLVGAGMVAFSDDGSYEVAGEVDVAALARVERTRWDRGALVSAGASRSGLVRAFFAAP